MTTVYPPYLGVDEDWAKADPAGLAAQGFHFVIGYVSEDTTGKNITRAQVDARHAVGLDVGLVYEYSVMSALGGASRGTRDAGIAISHAEQLGAPAGVALYAAVDFNPTTDQLPTVLAYADAFQAACTAAGYRAGIYGGYAACAYLGQHGWTGFLWQTYAWSAGQWWPGAVVQQTQNGVHIADAVVDQDQSEALDWGQWEADMTSPNRFEMNADQYQYEIVQEHDPIGGIIFDDGQAHTVPNLPLQRAKRIEQDLADIKAAIAALAAPPAVDTAALASDLIVKLEQDGIVTQDGMHTAIKQVLDAKLAAAQAA